MKERIKLPLALTLALAGSNALALGLGPIQVKSGLNQPLVAEIQVNGGADETAGLAVALASATDFERVGLSRSRVTVPLEFSVVPGGKGGAVIHITTKDVVHDPFLDFLIEVNWAKGKLLREYTVLLDPPVTAPAVKGSSAKMAPVKESAPAASTRPLDTPAAKPAKAPRTEPSTSATASSTPAPAPKPSRAAQSGEYGPINTGEALWDIASATRPDSSVSVDQMMLALLRSNPGAFYQDNINSLKRGAILRIPSSEEIKAAMSAAAAAAEVKSQTDAWRSGTIASKPTLVASTGTPTTPSKPASSASTAKPGDQLALVPPKAGTGSQTTGDRPTTGSGTGDAASKAELARTKEALASREQESGELKSRVKELEDLRTKNERLLNLKDNELAELQKKLKEVQDKSAKTAASSSASTPTTTVTTPSSTVTSTSTLPSTSTSTAASTTPSTASTTTPSTKPASSGITKEDIWGSGSATDTKPASSLSSASSTASTTTPSSTTPSTSASTPTTTTTATGTTPSTSLASASSTSTTSALPTTSSTDTTTPSTSLSSASGTSTTIATPSSTTTTTTPSSTTPTSTTTAAKPSTPAKVQPLPVVVEDPWYKKTWILAAAGLALLAVVILGLLNFLRRPKAVPVGGVDALPLMDGHDEEHDLLDRLALQPDDTAAHLELVSLYYARQDVDKFEAAAQAMYAHLGANEAAEWEQVKAMGAELAPHNSLFTEDVSGAHYDTAPTAYRETMAFDAFEDAHSLATSPPPVPADDAFDFDLTDHSATRPPPAAPAMPVDNFTLNMPAMDFDRELNVEPARSQPTPPPPSPRIEEDFGLGNEDATGTKLDLAKAYLDMGDPEGARSMLEEVVAEGNAAQKAEANRLIKEIR